MTEPTPNTPLVIIGFLSENPTVLNIYRPYHEFLKADKPVMLQSLNPGVFKGASAFFRDHTGQVWNTKVGSEIIDSHHTY